MNKIISRQPFFMTPVEILISIKGLFKRAVC